MNINGYPRPYRSGFVTLCGSPNMGKSTLINRLLGTELCTVTRKPQTTRHSILGLLTDEGIEVGEEGEGGGSTDITDNADNMDYGLGSLTQLALLDTPGVIPKRSYLLHQSMMTAVNSGLDRGDIALVVSDIFGVVPEEEEGRVLERLRGMGRRVIVLVNKIDLEGKVGKKGEGGEQEKGKEEEVGGGDDGLGRRTTDRVEAVKKWRSILPDALCILPISAQTGENVGLLRKLIFGRSNIQGSFRDLGRPIAGMFPKGEKTLGDNEILGLVPEGEPMYPKDSLTDRTERFVAGEIIRGVVFEQLRKEVPYACEVIVNGFTESPTLRRVEALIVVERTSQKGLVIGKGGAKVKEIGVEARKRLGEWFRVKVHLDLKVKVEKEWRRNKGVLKQYGYEEG